MVLTTLPFLSLTYSLSPFSPTLPVPLLDLSLMDCQRLQLRGGRAGKQRKTHLTFFFASSTMGLLVVLFTMTLQDIVYSASVMQYLAL